MDELGSQIKVPLRVRIQGFSFINKHPSDTNQILIEVFHKTTFSFIYN